MAATGDYREVCLQSKGERCVMCGANEDIVVHHLDGDRSNNELENLIPVCREHHAKIHHDHPEVESYASQLPEHAKYSTQGRSEGGRKTVTITKGAFHGLSAYKRDSESWSEFFWRLASELEGVEEQPTPVLTEDHMDELARMVGEEAADRVESRLRR